MKRIYFLLVAAVALLASCQSNVSGSLAGGTTDTLVVVYFPLGTDPAETAEMDTVALRNGAFSFSLPNDDHALDVYFYCLPAHQGDYTRLITFPLFPGDEIHITGDWADYQLSGTPLYEEFSAFLHASLPYRAVVDSVGMRFSELYGSEDRSEAAQYYYDVYVPALEAQEKCYADYIREHPESELSLYLLSLLDIEDAVPLYPHLGEGAHTPRMAPLFDYVTRRVAVEAIREEARRNIEEGQFAPDFTLTDINGNTLTLSDLQGKYVVLDFWGSWCGWCIKGFPDMKKYYARYSDRMEILGIACRDTEEDWREAVEEYQLPWLQVRNDAGTANDLTIRYAIEGYPTKMVLDPEGKILKVVIGEDPAFYDYLDSLFQR